MTSSSRFAAVCTFSLAYCQFASAADDGATMPPNLGRGLRQLAGWHAAHTAGLPEARKAGVVTEHLQAAGKRVQSDAAGRVVADVYLSGKAAAADVRGQLQALGAKIIAAEPAGHSLAARNGLFSVYLPLAQAAGAAALPGVQSISLVHRPWRHVGSVTSRGVAAMKANVVQARRFTGAGITVGVLSDSYDLVAPHASVDVVRDDLPGIGNRARHTTPVYVLAEGDPTSSPTDEGRAMLQIVHDVAPGAALAFASTGPTQASFADVIRGLRTDPGAHCDVLVDDIGYPDEPFFSTGIVAQAVEDVVNSTTLAGRPVIYYSAAGNEGELGYEADFSPVTDTAARNGQAGTNNLKLNQVPASLTGGGFHNFTPGDGVNIAQQFIINGSTTEVDFQWNDLFDPTEITSDYNLLVFDAAGNYLPNVSGTDNNTLTGQALEIVDLDPNPDGSDLTYQFAIARRSGGTGAAQHFRYFANGGSIGGTYLQTGIPTVVGHSGSRSGDGVGAYQYNKLAETEQFSSFGPVTIYFDDAGNRLANPEVRQQPTVCGPDGVATSMPAFRSFFGTSAAAPHVAGVAALALQASGGSGTLSAVQMRTALQSTALKHDLDPLGATAQFGTAAAGTVTLTGHGDESNFSSADPKFFTLQFSAPAGTVLQNIAIDLSGAALKFDPSTDLGLPFTVADTTGGVSTTVTPVLASSRGIREAKLTLTFASFPAGGTMQFGIDRDVARTMMLGNSGNELARATVTASILEPGAAKPVVTKGIFVNTTGNGYTPDAGFGFVNADAALRSLGH